MTTAEEGVGFCDAGDHYRQQAEINSSLVRELVFLMGQ
jgi:hypothetical protein